jgi:hypothetical protein
MPLNELWDRRRKILSDRIVQAAKQLIEHTDSEGFNFHFDYDGKRYHCVIGTKQTVRSLSDLIEE